MNKWTKTYTFILIGVILSALIIYAICFITITKPLQEELRSVETQAEMFETRLKTIANQEEQEIGDDLLEASMKVPLSKSPDNVLVNLQAIASESNVTIDSISSSAGETGEEDAEFVQTDYTLEVMGDDIISVHSFLDDILESDRLMTLSNLSIYQREDSVVLSITITTYHTN